MYRPILIILIAKCLNTCIRAKKELKILCFLLIISCLQLRINICVHSNFGDNEIYRIYFVLIIPPYPFLSLIVK